MRKALTMAIVLLVSTPLFSWGAMKVSTPVKIAGWLETGGGFEPIWDPQGTRLAFVVSEKFTDVTSELYQEEGVRECEAIWIMDWDGKNLRRLTPPSPCRLWGVTSWSQDGRYILGGYSYPAGKTPIGNGCVLDASTGELKYEFEGLSPFRPWYAEKKDPVPHFEYLYDAKNKKAVDQEKLNQEFEKRGDHWPKEYKYGGGLEQKNPYFQMKNVTITEVRGGKKREGELWLKSSDPKKEKMLMSKEDFANISCFSPDHTKAILADKKGNWYVINTDGTDMTMIAEPSGGGRQGPINWAPDSKKFIFLRHDPATPQVTDLPTFKVEIWLVTVE